MAAFYQESDYENALLELFEQHLGYEYVCGYHIDHNVKSPLYDEVLEEIGRKHTAAQTVGRKHFQNQ